MTEELMQLLNETKETYNIADEDFQAIVGAIDTTINEAVANATGEIGEQIEDAGEAMGGDEG